MKFKVYLDLPTPGTGPGTAYHSPFLDLAPSSRLARPRELFWKNNSFLIIYILLILINLKATLSLLWQLLLSAVNLCKQFEPKSGLTKCQFWSGSNLFDTLIVFLKEFIEKS